MAINLPSLSPPSPSSSTSNTGEFSVGEADASFNGIVGGTRALLANVTFSNGQVLQDVASHAYANGLLTYSSDEPRALNVTAEDGQVVLLRNWYERVNLHVRPSCAAGGDMNATLAVAANVHTSGANSYDIDLGDKSGVPLYTDSNGKVHVEVRAHPGHGELLALEAEVLYNTSALTVLYNTSALTALSCSVVSWQNYLCTVNDPPGVVRVLQHRPDSLANYTTLIATVHFVAIAPALTWLGGTVVEMVVLEKNDTITRARSLPITAGAGALLTYPPGYTPPAGQDLALPEPFASPPSAPPLPPAGECGSCAAFPLGDLDGDCEFGAHDLYVAYALEGTVTLLTPICATAGTSGPEGPIAGTSKLATMRDVTLDGFVSSSDSIYLSNVLGRKGRFVVNASLESGALLSIDNFPAANRTFDDSIRFDVTVVGYDGLSADDAATTRVRLEIDMPCTPPAAGTPNPLANNVTLGTYDGLATLATVAAHRKNAVFTAEHVGGGRSGPGGQLCPGLRGRRAADGRAGECDSPIS
ncbi:hypothetical protein T492DRAFT_837603 [Pavlovales sp. CCMP2436]|nr:hypothetical protein T492DRAFT_837603 [Pavlovales sp. CCMP2436]